MVICILTPPYSRPIPTGKKHHGPAGPAGAGVPQQPKRGHLGKGEGGLRLPNQAPADQSGPVHANAFPIAQLRLGRGKGRGFFKTRFGAISEDLRLSKLGVGWGAGEPTAKHAAARSRPRAPTLLPRISLGTPQAY